MGLSARIVVKIFISRIGSPGAVLSFLFSFRPDYLSPLFLNHAQSRFFKLMLLGDDTARGAPVCSCRAVLPKLQADAVLPLYQHYWWPASVCCSVFLLRA